MVLVFLYCMHYIRNLSRLNTMHLLYFIQYITLKYNCTHYHKFTFICMEFVYFCLAAICIAITLHQSNQTRSTTSRTFMNCKYSNFSYSILCNLQLIKFTTNFHNIFKFQIKCKRRVLILIIHKGTVELVKIGGID